MKRIAQSFSTTLVLIALSTTLTSCLSQSDSKSSSGGTSSSTTVPVKWSSSDLSGGMNVVISTDIINDFVADDLDSNDYNPVEQMFEKWNDTTTAATFFKVPASTTSNKSYDDLSSYKDSEMGVYKSYDWFDDVKTSVLAVTQYYGYRRNSGTSAEYIQLSHADVILNYRDHDFSTSASDSSSYDFHSVVLHELGHFLGLSHTSSYSISSVMQSSLGVYDSKRTPTNYDVSTITDLYGGSSALTSSSYSVAASAATSSDTTLVLPSAAVDTGDGEIHGLIELHADGQCAHYENGVKVFEHKSDI